MDSINEPLSSDKPVTSKADDRFQRFEFASRIAETIAKREESEGIVLGLYGAWGEGKTSVLNFIRTQLLINSDIVVIDFNPWRYNDEEILLKDFFSKIAHCLDVRLNTKIERIGEFIDKWGSLTGLLGYDVADIGKKLSGVDLEVLKNRIDELLKASKSKLVIIIDDIDRLDKHELYSIFKLVKLNADFINTTYLLSFDEKMVATAIGGRYGESQESGFQFLEKIIQVPLNLPQAQTDALQDFCLELINKAAKNADITFDDAEKKRFGYQFVQAIAIRLKTPRLAVRYGNSLAFSFPLLKDEVNHVDLLLIEAMKIFYPAHYEFVKSNPHYFLTVYTSTNRLINVEQLKTDLKLSLDELGSKLTRKENDAVKDLLIELFPTLAGAFRNTYYHNGHVKWTNAKRIVSSQYFNRFFTYTVIKGQVPDVLFTSFIDAVKVGEKAIYADLFNQIVKISSIKKVVEKLRNFEEDCEWTVAQNISLLLAEEGNLFAQNESKPFGFLDGPFQQVAIFIYKVIFNHNPREEGLLLAEDVLRKASSVEYALEIAEWLCYQGEATTVLFAEEQCLKLKRTLVEKAISQAADKPLFEAFPELSYQLLSMWRQVNQIELHVSIKKSIEEKPDRILELIYTLCPTLHRLGAPEAITSDITEKWFETISSVLDVELVHDLIEKYHLPVLNSESAVFFDTNIGQTPINSLRQFEYWFSKRKEGLENVDIS